jgi:hypothetical protein
MPVVQGSVKARDLRANIAELGFEKGVTSTLELLLEEHSVDRLRMRDMMQLVEMCIKQIDMMVEISGSMKGVIEGIQRAVRGDADEG